MKEISMMWHNITAYLFELYSEFFVVIQNIRLDDVEKLASILGNIGIFIITAYGFWLYHFSKKLKIISLSQDYSQFFGDNINCTIYNKTMSPKTITNISVVFDNKYLVNIKNFKEPFLLEPFHAYNILGDRYSNAIKIPPYTNVYFKLNTPEKTLNVHFMGKILKNKKLETITKNTIKFNEIVISEQIKYVLIYWYKGKEDKSRIIYITYDGFMDKNLKNINVLPRDIMESSEKIKDFFKDLFDNENICFQLNELN